MDDVDMDGAVSPTRSDASGRSLGVRHRSCAGPSPAHERTQRGYGAPMTDFADWQAVYDLSLRYAEAIDRRRWDDLCDVFAPTVRVDFSSFSGAPASPDPVEGPAWVSVVRGTIDGFVSTQHLIANHRITVESPTTARYTAYVQAQHWMSRDRWYLVGGSYDNEATCTDGRWRLSAITFNQTWDAGDRGLLREAGRLARGR